MYADRPRLNIITQVLQTTSLMFWLVTSPYLQRNVVNCDSLEDKTEPMKSV